MPQYGDPPKGQALLSQFEAKSKGRYEFDLFPELWRTADIGSYYRGRQWQSNQFVENVLPDHVPNESGIYMFVAAPHCGTLRDHSYIMYIGQARNLRTRYGQYFREKRGETDHPREPVVRFLNHLQDWLFFWFTLVPQDELDHAEALLKDNITPYGNTVVKIIGRLGPTQTL
jgi:hypothetical protein